MKETRDLQAEPEQTFSVRLNLKLSLSAASPIRQTTLFFTTTATRRDIRTAPVSHSNIPRSTTRSHRFSAGKTAINMSASETRTIQRTRVILLNTLSMPISLSLTQVLPVLSTANSTKAIHSSVLKSAQTRIRSTPTSSLSALIPKLRNSIFRRTRRLLTAERKTTAHARLMKTQYVPTDLSTTRSKSRTGVKTRPET